MRSPVLKQIALVLLVAGVIAAGWYASSLWDQRALAATQKRLHAEMASIRAYEESYALRNGRFLLLPSSCLENADVAWQALGRPAPAAGLGCFEVAHTADSHTTAPVTAETMVIIGISPHGDVKGAESSTESQPRWTFNRP